MAVPTTDERLTLYAVDALGQRDRRAVENHLPHCPRCRARLVELGESGVMLERDRGVIESEAVDPPQALLSRILDQAEVQQQPPQRLRRVRRWLVGAVSLALLLAACTASLWAVGDGAWNARAYGLQGAEGLLRVDPHGHAVLIVRELKPATKGREYKAWLLHKGRSTLAAVFAGGAPVSVVPLSRALSSIAVVAV